MNINRKLARVLLIGAGVGLTGCQSTSLGNLAFWNKNNSAASAAPDVSQQRFDGLSQQLKGNSSGAAGHALGAPLPAESSNFLVASWKKTSAAVSGAMVAKPKGEPVDDPLRLDNPPKKVGPEVHVAAARLLENQGRFPEAETQYHKALELAPEDLNALVGLARLHDRQGRWQDAVALYQKALKNNATSALVYNDLGLCYARQRQLDASLQALGKAVELQPTAAKYRNNFATVLVESGRIDEAVKQLSINNSPALAHYNVGHLLEQKGRTAEALRHCQQAVALDANLAPAHQMLARLGGNVSAPPVAVDPGPSVGRQTLPSQGPFAPAASSQQPPANVRQAAGAEISRTSFHITDEGTR